MGDSKMKSTSKAVDGTSKSSKDAKERAKPSQRSISDPAPSVPTRSFSASHASPSKMKGRPQMEALADEDAIEDDDYNSEDEKDVRPAITKRHSSSGHSNVHTECGRHGDEWLFGGISGVVKSVFKKSATKKRLSN